MSPTPDFVTSLVPVLGRSHELGFNVFDVMHHGLHEKQLSNVFRWLLNAEGTHRLCSRFAEIFVDEINKQIREGEPLTIERFVVRQEVNTSLPGDGADIADLVLESDSTVIVIENYYTSDGHGHSYSRYKTYSERDGRRGCVVLLCADVDPSLQTRGWEHATVLPYAGLLGRLLRELDTDPAYQRDTPQAFAFIEQMYRKFVTQRGTMQDQDIVAFVTAMCATGEAARYQAKDQEVAAAQFGSDMADQARERFNEGRDLLQRVKRRLRDFSAGPLAEQLNATLGEGFVTNVSARYAGLYQWTVNFELAEDAPDTGKAKLQLKFGPSAWFAVEKDDHWRRSDDPRPDDYEHVFVTYAAKGEIRRSTVTMDEVLKGLESTDRRLHDEIVKMIRADAPHGSPTDH